MVCDLHHPVHEVALFSAFLAPAGFAGPEFSASLAHILCVIQAERQVREKRDVTAGLHVVVVNAIEDDGIGGWFSFSLFLFAVLVRTAGGARRIRFVVRCCCRIGRGKVPLQNEVLHSLPQTRERFSPTIEQGKRVPSTSTTRVPFLGIG